MSGDIIVITGGSDGIGAAGAAQLVKKGNQVVLVGRSAAKTKEVASRLGATYFLADFADLSQVRKLAADLAAQLPRIDVLINNAGGIMGARELTVDGHEKTFQVNHLAGFLLTTSLLPTLISSKARVLNTSSMAHRMWARVNIDDLELTHGYSPNLAYGNSKLMNILFTKELHRRYHPQGISTAAFHPGVIASNFAHESSTPLRIFYGWPFRYFLTTSEKGAENMVWLATSRPGIDWKSGEYYVKHAPGRTSPQANDSELARKLWDVSVDMVGAVPAL